MNTQKRILAAVLAVLMLLSAAPLSGLFATQAQAADDSSYLPYYRDVFTAYQKVIKANFYRKSGIPETLPKYVSELLVRNKIFDTVSNTIYYALYDINQNGFPELLIGDKDEYAAEGWSIFGLYTYTNKINIFGESVSSWGYRASGYIFKSGVIAERGAYSAGNTAWTFYLLDNNDKAKYLDTIMRDDWYDVKYYRGKDATDEGPDKQHISSKQADQLFQSYLGKMDPDNLKSNIKIKWKRFSTLPSKIGALAQPAKLKVSAANRTSLKLTWGKVSGAKGYVVYRYLPSTQKYVKLTTVKSASATIKSLSPNTTYRFAVRAYSKPASKVLYSKTSKLLAAKTAR